MTDIIPSPWRPLRPADFGKAAAVSASLISRLDFVTDWRLQKSYYLAEVWSIEERLTRLSAAEFASWTHGPWSLHVREASESLEAGGVIERYTKPARRQPEAEFLRMAKPKAAPKLEEDEAEFLERVAEQIRFLDGDTLTKVAKRTLPYLETKPQLLIDLDGYLEDIKRKHARLVESPRIAALVAEAKAE